MLKQIFYKRSSFFKKLLFFWEMRTMKNVTLFLCDIHGTYIKNNELVSRQEIEKLLENLEKLRMINDSKKIIFSFVSTES